ncbi:hypothetical protein MYSTI_05768 [Myxococcus stipitatus DSM 14675]|uniref:Lipoprotein n=1 Tax=Myxococcus stipitatus (strain DSM 14675 / JCM 12634 / Mx s8) TaxID=1278073 RepID=L7UKS4_MYXSD|nr:hypothetical protein [Myxococcus stipitatus]AGC47044.1 hypothetical protein MYSTI_05768 [Myxococcus stipitatus DSM 14675]
MFIRLCASLLAAAISVGCGSGEPDRNTDDAAGVTSVVRPATHLKIAPGVPVSIEWVSTIAGTATVDLFADADGDLETTADQIPLASGHAVATAPAVFDWRTDDVPLGTYRLLARRVDRLGTHVSTAPGLVEVVKPLLEVENLEAGEPLRYPLALLTGTVPTEVTEVSAGLHREPMRAWPATGGRFKTLVRLAPGTNDVLLEAGGVLHRFPLSYAPMTTSQAVRFVYVVAADAEGRFDAPEGEPNDLASALRRIGTGAELMQTFTAEALAAQGLGRRTFHFERDGSGAPVVTVFRSRLTTALAHQMDGLALWRYFYGEFGSLPNRPETIDVVIMSMTHFDPVQKQVLAHTALGGGRLGLFGSGTLHTWAESLDEVAARFLDERRIDTSVLLDDSAGRGTHWANYATGLGATMHELGHCFSLHHPVHGKGVMSRDFDFINRTFMGLEPRSATSAGLSPVLPVHETGWDRSSAVRLGFHRWLHPDRVASASNAQLVLRETATDVTFEARTGVRHVAWNVEAGVLGHEEFLGVPPLSVTLSKQSLRERFPGEATLRSNMMDSDGNMAEQVITLQE